MDTIIYLYRWEEPEEYLQHSTHRKQYCWEQFHMLDYHLVRVGITKYLFEICSQYVPDSSMWRDIQGSSVMPVKSVYEEQKSFLSKNRRKKQLRQERMLLADFFRDITLGHYKYSFVCEEPLPFFEAWRFNGYFETDWVKHMLRYVESMPVWAQEKDQVNKWGNHVFRLSNLIILGQTCCVPDLLCERARFIRSLKWILPKRQYLEQQQEITDILYEEYGLAVEVRLLSEEESYKQVYPLCHVPSLVLDFSETDRIPTADVARGSIWLDMASSEEKRRRVEDRDTGICYFSLKKEWKHPQKALNYLDTISKNGYNT